MTHCTITSSRATVKATYAWRRFYANNMTFSCMLLAYILGVLYNSLMSDGPLEVYLLSRQYVELKLLLAGIVAYSGLMVLNVYKLYSLIHRAAKQWNIPSDTLRREGRAIARQSSRRMIRKVPVRT